MLGAQEDWREAGTGTWVEGAEIGFVRDKGLTHTHIHEKRRKKAKKKKRLTEKKNDSTQRSQI